MELREPLTTVQQSSSKATMSLNQTSIQAVNPCFFMQSQLAHNLDFNKLTPKSVTTYNNNNYNNGNVQMGRSTNNFISSSASPATTSMYKSIISSQNLDSMQTLTNLDGHFYQPSELIQIINRLRQENQSYINHIKWLEQELFCTKSLLDARDRNIDELKSVLDQTVHVSVQNMPVQSVQPINKNVCLMSSEFHGYESINEKLLHKERETMYKDRYNIRCEEQFYYTPTQNQTHQSDVLRIKKQGVSGESFNQLLTTKLIHHPKDAW